MSTGKSSFVFNPDRLAKHFSALQPAAQPVVSGLAAVPSGCVQTTLELRTVGESARAYRLALPLKTAEPNETPDSPRANRAQWVMTAELPAPVLQILAGGEHETPLAVSVNGPAQCPPGRDHEIHVTAPDGELLARIAPFQGWTIPIPSPLDPDILRAEPEPILSTLHPCRATGLTPAIWKITVPACRALQLEATVAVFPDVRWQGELTVEARPDPASQRGFTLKVKSTLTCTHAGARWRLREWADTAAWCPWLGCVESLGRTVAAIDALGRDSRAQGLDNPRLVKAGPIEWSPRPNARVTVESALYEQPNHGLLGHRLRLAIAGTPLLAGAGELSLLPDWMELPSWRQLLAPLLAGLTGTHVSEIAQQLGLWLVAAGHLSLRVHREEDRPAAEPRIGGEARGEIALTIEGRTERDYETIVVRSGGAAQAGERAGLTLQCLTPEDNGGGGSPEKGLHGRCAFSGLALWSVEKYRPGIRVRRLTTPVVSDAPKAHQPAPPLSVLLSARAWPAAAAEKAVEIPWCPA